LVEPSTPCESAPHAQAPCMPPWMTVAASYPAPAKGPELILRPPPAPPRSASWMPFGPAALGAASQGAAAPTPARSGDAAEAMAEAEVAPALSRRRRLSPACCQWRAVSGPAGPAGDGDGDGPPVRKAERGRSVAGMIS
jgi:hypothetical protein